MSSGLDTATRRQIRKAFGPDALKVLEAHEQGLRAHAATLAYHDDEIKAIRALHASYYEHLAERLPEYADGAALRCPLIEPLRRGFFGRLRWLLRGT